MMLSRVSTWHIPPRPYLDVGVSSVHRGKSRRDTHWAYISLVGIQKDSPKTAGITSLRKSSLERDIDMPLNGNGNVKRDSPRAGWYHLGPPDWLFQRASKSSRVQKTRCRLQWGRGEVKVQVGNGSTCR